MMPDLGTYATEVLLAYAGSLLLLAVLIGWTWQRARRIRQQLSALETRISRTPHG